LVDHQRWQLEQSLADGTAGACKPQLTAQTISFTAPPTATYGSAIALTATATSGLAPAFTVGSGLATFNDSQLTFTGVDSVVVQVASDN
jgi:hypothetical protein